MTPADEPAEEEPTGPEGRGEEPPRDAAASAAARRRAVRRQYGAVAEEGAVEGDTGDGCQGEDPVEDDVTGCCGGATTDSSGAADAEDGGCCSGAADGADARTLGYADDDVAAVPEAAYLGLGCGNPNAIAALEPGETVLDLGCGGGFDCLLAARAVGEAGRVVGVDMTPEMVERARENAERADTDAVEIRLGEIEHLPVGDERVDVAISNCVVNLSPDKGSVFAEVHRVLRPGGRLAISDVVATPAGREALDGADPAAVAGCIGGAATAERLRDRLERAGFRSVTVRRADDSEKVVDELYGDADLADALYAGVIEAEKPPS